MPRPNQQNRLSIKASEWYTAPQLVAAGFDAFCCADRVALLLAATEDHGIRTRDVNLHGVDFDDRKFYRQRVEFKFTSRKRAKLIKRELVRLDSIVRLGGLVLHDWVAACECSFPAGQYYKHSGKDTNAQVTARLSRIGAANGEDLATKIKSTYTRSGKKR